MRGSIPSYLNTDEKFVAWLARQIGERKWIVARASKKRRKDGFDTFFTERRFDALDVVFLKEAALMEPSDNHLTEPNPDLEAKRRRTPPGMAFWAGTGPAGKTCRECIHWSFDDQRGYMAGSGLLRDVPCEKYTRMMNGAASPPIPHYAAACKYFEESSFVPPVEQPKLQHAR